MTPLRFHHLKAWAEAPIFAQAALDGAEGDDTACMEVGTAGHAMVFGNKEVTFYPKARNEKHAEYKAFLESHPNAHILTEAEYRKTSELVRAIKRNPRAMELLRGQGVVNEGTLLAKLQGRECRATPDARGPEGIVELKFSNKADPIGFYYQVKRMGYHAQLAWQARVARAAGVPFGPGRYIVAVKTGGRIPLAQVYRLPPDLVDEGDRLCTMWLEGLLNCERSDAWPGYGPDEMLLEQPFADNGLVWGSDDADQGDGEQAA